MKISIRKKIFLVVIVAILGMVGMVAVTNLILMHDNFRQQLLLSIEGSVSIYQRFASQRRDLMLMKAESIANIPYLKAALAIPDIDEETIAASTFPLDIGDTASLLVLNTQKEILVARNFEAAEPRQVTRISGIDQALQGQTFYGVSALDDQLYQLAIAPSFSGDEIVGLVVIAERLDSIQAMESLSDITTTPLAYAVAGRLYAAQHDRGSDYSKELLTAITSEKGTLSDRLSLQSAREVEISGVAHFVALIPLGGGGHLVFYNEATARSAAVDKMRRLIALRGAAALFLGVLFSWWISSLITRRVRDMVDATKKFGEGDFDVRVEPKSEDEFGQLANSFNQMADQIVLDRTTLVASREAAEAANRAKSTFLATMSHEIRTPLNGVLGMTQVVSNSLKDPGQQRNLDIIMESGNNLLEIINDILDFSKIEAGKLELTPSLFDLRRFMADLCSTQGASARSKGLELICSLPPEIAFKVEADSTRLRRVLANLIGNAIKFTSDGRVEVTVRLVNRKGDTARFLFEVTDMGIGIPLDRVEKIFEAFTQAHASTTREFGGTGLGLAISRQLVDMMGGRIEVSSVPGRGSCFSFSLELKVQPSEPMSESRSTDRPDAISGHSEIDDGYPAIEDQATRAYKGRRVLVVEDGPVNQEVAKALLEWHGCEVEIASNGLVALDRTANEHFELIFMDCQMPEMDGYEATRALRKRQQEEGGPRIPIVALTANAVQGDREACLAVDMDDYIAKPFTNVDISEILKKWLPQ